MRNLGFAAVILTALTLNGGPANAYSCSGLGSQASTADLVSCLKELSREIDRLEEENSQLKQQMRSIDSDTAKQSRDVDATLERIGRDLDSLERQEFKLQCRRAYGSCAYGMVLLSQPGSDGGVCCAVVPRS